MTKIIINIYFYNCQMCASRFQEQRVVIFGLKVALLFEKISQFDKPLPRSLFKAIK